MSGADFLDILGTHFLICTDKVEGNGEDSGLEYYNRCAGLIGAFDGCGGLGFKVSPAANNKTEAFLASRSVGNALKLWFEHCCDSRKWDLDLLKQLILINLEHCKAYSNDDSFVIKGTLLKSYPSTLAAVVSYPKRKKIMTQHIWAGDSRTFILDINGVGQVTRDDIRGGDAMVNLTNDGSLTDVVSLSGDFVLHSKTIELSRPSVLIAATDGCFGYVPSPMEFEYILLSSLHQSGNSAEWQEILREEFSSRSGDDQTIAVEAIGFESFREMKKYFLNRCRYIGEIGAFLENDVDEMVIQELWNGYKSNYYRFMD